MTRIYVNRRITINNIEFKTGINWIDNYLTRTQEYERLLNNKTIQVYDKNVEELFTMRDAVALLNSCYNDEYYKQVNELEQEQPNFKPDLTKFNYLNIYKKLSDICSFKYFKDNFDKYKNDAEIKHSLDGISDFIDNVKDNFKNFENKNTYNNALKVQRELRLVRHIGSLVDTQVYTNSYKSGKGNSYTRTNRSWYWNG